MRQHRAVYAFLVILILILAACGTNGSSGVSYQYSQSLTWMHNGKNIPFGSQYQLTAGNKRLDDTDKASKVEVSFTLPAEWEPMSFENTYAFPQNGILDIRVVLIHDSTSVVHGKRQQIQTNYVIEFIVTKASLKVLPIIPCGGNSAQSKCPNMFTSALGIFPAPFFIPFSDG